jgi:hypothetical protein
MKKFLMIAAVAVFFANVALADDAPAGGDKPAPAKKSSKSSKSSKSHKSDKAAPAGDDKAAAPANP